MTEADQELKIKIDHPEFHSYNLHGADDFPVVVFQRRRFYTPTDKQIAEYRRDKQIVEAQRGVMMLMEHECAGEQPPLNEKDIAEMIAATLAALPDYEVRETWNGVGYLSLSISIKLRAERAQSTETERDASLTAPALLT